MKTSHIISLLIGSLTLAGCGAPKTEVKTDRVNIAMPDIDIDNILRGIEICRKDQETQDYSKIALANIFEISDIIANQDFEVKGCDDKTIRKGISAVRELKQTIDLPKPTALDGRLEFVEIQNDRTCKTLRVKVLKNDEYQNYGLTQKADGSQERIEFLTTRSNEDGEMQILLSDSTSLIGTAHLLNVADGKNQITVKYYGECLEQREKINEKLGPESNCKTGKEIGSQIFGIDVKVDRSSKVSEVKTTKECNK